jgi:hypothetical protein
MIHRKIAKVKTKGSRITNDLAPDLADLTVGINYAVHEYNEKENYCILELWCCDHSLQEKKATMADLNELCKDPSVLEVLTSHPKSPKTLGVLSMTSVESVDEVAKEVTVKGKKERFLRKEKLWAHGKEFDCFVLDEG